MKYLAILKVHFPVLKGAEASLGDICLPLALSQATAQERTSFAAARMRRKHPATHRCSHNWPGGPALRRGETSLTHNCEAHRGTQVYYGPSYKQKEVIYDSNCSLGKVQGSTVKFLRN